MESEHIKQLRAKINEHFEYSSMVDRAIESLELEISYPEEASHRYDASIETNKGNFKVTASIGCDILVFLEARTNIDLDNCDAIIVVKGVLTEDLKDRVDEYNKSNKENKIHLIYGDNEKNLKDKFFEILK